MALATDDDVVIDPVDEGEAPDIAVVDEQADAAPPAEEAVGEVVVTLGDEPPAEDEDHRQAPDWVRELRKANREKDRRIRELEQRVAAAAPVAAPVVVGTKPTLAACDYDEDRFDKELEAWHLRKRDADEAQRKKDEQARAAQDAWQAKLADYGRAKTALKVADFEDAEAVAQEVFSVAQQGIMLSGAENAALLVYALGRNPKKARELAAITDPVKFSFAVAKLETQLKVTPRKSAPVPERTVRGSAPISGSVDSNLERLRAEAEKTGDLTKVHQYRQQLRSKAPK